MNTNETEVAADSAIDTRILHFQNVVNEALASGWLDDESELIENAIKLFTPPPPKYSKQRTYAIKNLKAVEYDSSLKTHEPVRVITEEQIQAEMGRMEQEKQAKTAKKSK